MMARRMRTNAILSGTSSTKPVRMSLRSISKGSHQKESSSYSLRGDWRVIGG